MSITKKVTCWIMGFVLVISGLGTMLCAQDVARPTPHGEKMEMEGDGNIVEIDIVPVAKMLERYGPWGVTLVLLIAIFFLYRHSQSQLTQQRHEFAESIEKVTNQFIALVDRLTTMFRD